MPSLHFRRMLFGTALAGIVGLGAVTVRQLSSADHIDAPITTNDADADINDVFVFTSPSDPSRVVFAMTVHPLIAPAEATTAQFPTNMLYQWKIDTDADAVEELVIQARVIDDNGTPTLVIRGPAAPLMTGTETRELQDAAVVSGRVSTASEAFVIEGSNGVRAFAGVRDDPFYIDLTQLLAILGGSATSFNDPGSDTLEGLNTLAIVVEIPISMLGGATNIGVWATSSRATS